jgi:hypothetical protein
MEASFLVTKTISRVLQQELTYRILRVLLCFDRLISPGVGRPLSVQEEECVVNLLIYVLSSALITLQF